MNAWYNSLKEPYRFLLFLVLVALPIGVGPSHPAAYGLLLLLLVIRLLGRRV